MRIFDIRDGDEFTEYSQVPFQDEHEESILEDWLESNPDGILEDDRILIIGRQESTDLGGLIDLLGVDREGNLVVVELKRDRTPRDTIAQALEYTSFAAQLDAGQLEHILRRHGKGESLSLAEYHRDYFELDETEAVSFNKDQRIVVIGQRISPQIRRTASYLRSKGVRATCVEFSFFQNDKGSRLLCQDIVVGKEEPLFRRDFWAFYSERFPDDGSLKPGYRGSNVWYEVEELNVRISQYLAPHDSKVGIYIVGRRGDSIEALQQRLFPYEDRIRNELGVDLIASPANKHFAISVKRGIEPRDRDNWADIVDWFHEKLMAYRRILTKPPGSEPS